MIGLGRTNGVPAESVEDVPAVELSGRLGLRQSYFACDLSAASSASVRIVITPIWLER